MSFGDQPINDAFWVICPYKGFFITATGGVLGAVELQGVDPDALSREDAVIMAMRAADIYGKLSPYVSVTQYYVHAEGFGVTLRRREDRISDQLSQAREAALNGRGLATSRLIHVFEYREEEGWNDPLLKVILRNGPGGLLDPNKRRLLKARLFGGAGVVLRDEEITQRLKYLQNVLDEVCLKWSILFDAKPLSLKESWRFQKFLATRDEMYLDRERRIFVPDDDCDLALAAGDIEPVQINYTDMIKLSGARPRFVRNASIIKTPHNPVGLWSYGREAPVRNRGNFVFSSSFSPMTRIERSLMFTGAKRRIDRMNFDFAAVLGGNKKEQEPAQDTYVVRKMREELEKAEAIEDRFGQFCATVSVAHTDPIELIGDSVRMNRVLTDAQMDVVWETTGSTMSFKAMQPGGSHSSIRKCVATTSRGYAMSLLSKPTIGQPVVAELDGEEAQYVLETDDGHPFHFSPYVNGVGFGIAVGPPGSGKTFFKNTLTSNFMKYGGFSRSLDIDPGTETVAKFYGEDGGIIRLENDDVTGVRTGINPFASAKGEGDLAFVTHMIALTKAMLRSNDNAAAQTLEQYEQDELDKAVLATLRLDKPMQTLGHMIGHLPKETKAKFSRWVEGGIYNGLFNARTDGIGSMDKRLGVINLQAYKSNPNVLRPMLQEFIFRTTRLFEAPEYRHIPKELQVDESHLPLEIPGFPEFLVTGIRTWRKYFVSLMLWSQSPEEYKKVPGWKAVRSAASTFVFLADPRMDDALYKETFPLTDGMCQTIRSLVPKKEAFILQPDAGIAKRVIIRVEPTQQVINTSTPREVVLRDKLIAQYGMAEGFPRAVEALTASTPSEEEAAE